MDQPKKWVEIYGLHVSDHGEIMKSDKIVMPHHDSFGYPSTTAVISGKRKSVRVHRLVAQAFLERQQHQIEVNHKDGNPKNNHVSNLEWCTHRENMIHACRTGLRKKLGELHHWNKLPEHQIREIFKMRWVYGFSTRLIAKLFGISHQHVSDIARQNRCWVNLKLEYTI